MERFGATNVVVTNESADRLAKVFKGYFDLIVLDAPCSGEGMFRKQPDAMDYWSLDYPSQCASLQREILEDAVTMLAEGGRLVYSTCTWAPEENEEIVNWLLEEYDFDLLPVDHINGMVAVLTCQKRLGCTLISLRERVSLSPIYNLKVKILHLNVRQVRVTSAVNSLLCGRNLPKNI